MPTTIKTHESEVPTALNLSNLLLLSLVSNSIERLELSGSVLLVTRPLKSISPSLIAEPVTDEISITSVNQHGDLFEDTGDETVEGLHPITVEKEALVNTHIARIEIIDLGADCVLDFGLVEVLGDVVHSGVAEVAAVAIDTDIVRVAARALVRAEDGVVAVDGGGDTGPDALAAVA